MGRKTNKKRGKKKQAKPSTSQGGGAIAGQPPRHDDKMQQGKPAYLASSTDGAPPPEGAIRANDAAQNPERDAHYAPHRSIVEYTPGQTMHLFHPKDFCPEYDATVPVPAIAFFPGGGFRACG